MKKEQKPSAVSGKIQAPPSKSYAQRAIAIAAMANGNSELYFPGSSDDVNAAINVARQLGAEIRSDDSTLYVSGGLSAPAESLDCGEAGLSVRMFSSIAGIFNKPVVLTGRGSLLKRPMHIVENSLRAMGAECSTSGGFLPITVRGPIRGGVAEVDGSFSSQVLTGMLIAAPFTETDLTIKVRDLTSRPYIDITLAVMGHFGVEVENNDYSEFFIRSGQSYRPAKYTIEGDWSAAAFLLVAGAIAGEVMVENINVDSPQADRAILIALEMAGASLRKGRQSVSVAKRDLTSFEFDATHCPDLFPPLVSLAAYCKGTTILSGAERLLHKESNRAATLMEEFGKLGIEISVEGDKMIIKGGKCAGGTIFSHEDHRIAMACAVAALGAENPVIIEGAGAVAKSYPEFFEDMDTIINQSDFNITKG
jgi:3-phosphoshikimate 1-carboxyvinyltransferase